MLKFVLIVVLLASTGCTNPPTATAINTVATETVAPTATVQHTLPPTQPNIVPTADVAPEIKSWLREKAIPFDNTDPTGDFEDLMPLKELIGDARIVALGEATHGTHEFFEMKHRMLRFLVEEMGFNTFAIEANWPEANLVNEYIQTGEGDPAELLKEFFGWTGNTQEALDMIHWMRAHNENPGDAPLVSFSGFDMQFNKKAMGNVVAYLEKVDPDQVEQATALFRCFGRYGDRELRAMMYAYLPTKKKTECRANLQAVYDWLKQQQSVYEMQSSPREFAMVLQSANLVLQNEHHFGDLKEDSMVRDRYMAENVAWLLDQAGPDGKIVFSAHNGHVAKNVSGFKSMGSYLREVYGEEMLVFGFSFYEGSLNAKLLAETAQMGDQPGDLTEFAVPLPPEDSFESYFRSTELPRFFLDLRQLPLHPAARDWLSIPHLLRSIGSTYQPSHPEEFFDHQILPDLFDVIIYFEDTSPSLLLE